MHHAHLIIVINSICKSHYSFTESRVHHSSAGTLLSVGFQKHTGFLPCYLGLWVLGSKLQASYLWSPCEGLSQVAIVFFGYKVSCISGWVMALSASCLLQSGITIIAAATILCFSIQPRLCYNSFSMYNSGWTFACYANCAHFKLKILLPYPPHK